MPDREKILKADELIAELRDWLAERGWYVSRVGIGTDGDRVNSQFKQLPENDKT